MVWLAFAAAFSGAAALTLVICSLGTSGKLAMLLLCCSLSCLYALLRRQILVVRGKGLLSYFPPAVGRFFIHTTLVDFLMDTTFFDGLSARVKPFLPLLMYPTEPELRLAINSLPAQDQKLLFRPGMVHFCPTWIQRLLLPPSAPPSRNIEHYSSTTSAAPSVPASSALAVDVTGNDAASTCASSTRPVTQVHNSSIMWSRFASYIMWMFRQIHSNQWKRISLTASIFLSALVVSSRRNRRLLYRSLRVSAIWAAFAGALCSGAMYALCRRLEALEMANARLPRGMQALRQLRRRRGKGGRRLVPRSEVPSNRIQRADGQNS